MGVRLIQHDGEEAREETGEGHLTEIKEPKNGNAQVVINATHLTRAITAWVKVGDPEHTAAVKALESRELIRYVVIVKRKRGRLPGIPFEKVTDSADKVRELAAIGFGGDPAPAAAPASTTVASSHGSQGQGGAGGAPAGTLGAGEAAKLQALDFLTRASTQDQADMCAEMAVRAGATWDEVAQSTPRRLTPPARLDRGPQSASDPDEFSTNPAYSTAPPPPDPGREALERARDPHQLNAPPSTDGITTPPPPEPPAEGAQAAGAPSGPPPARPPAQQSGMVRGNAMATEKKPWDFYDDATNGVVNLGSYAASATLDFVKLAAWHMIGHRRAQAAADPTYVLATPTQKDLQGLASVLLTVADRVQVQMRGGGIRPDRMATSHKAARQMVRDALDLYPIPWESTREVVDAWRADLEAYSLVMAATMLALLR